MTVKIEKTDTTVKTYTVYNSDYIADAKMLGGKWDGEAWVFDIRDAKDVADLCFKHYGTDGVRSDLCDVKITYTEEDCADREAITFCGKIVARATGRDSGAKLGDGIILKSGGFSSGGSCKNWQTIAKSGTVVIVRDVAAGLVSAFKERGVEVEVIGENTGAKPTNDALIAEREALVARLAEIDAALGM